MHNLQLQNIQAGCSLPEERAESEADWYLALLISRALGGREEQKPLSPSSLLATLYPIFSDLCIMLS